MAGLLSIGTKIVAVGRNYAAHAKELGNAVPKVSFNLSFLLRLPPKVFVLQDLNFVLKNIEISPKSNLTHSICVGFGI